MEGPFDLPEAMDIARFNSQRDGDTYLAVPARYPVQDGAIEYIGIYFDRAIYEWRSITSVGFSSSALCRLLEPTWLRRRYFVMPSREFLDKCKESTHVIPAHPGNHTPDA